MTEIFGKKKGNSSFLVLNDVAWTYELKYFIIILGWKKVSK